jgi:hypothetical protein
LLPLWDAVTASITRSRLREAGADGRLAGDERRAAGGAALLAIPVGEERAFPFPFFPLLF